MIEFAYKFADSLEIGPTENQVGVVIFSTYGQVVFNLSTYSDKIDLLSAINTIPYLDEGTNTGDGLRILIEEGFTEESGARLSSSTVYRLAIVMTDGHSNNITKTKEAAEAVHNFYPPILVFAIGVTTSVNREELEAIATRGEYITFLSRFDESQFVETRDEQTYELCVKSKFSEYCLYNLWSVARPENSVTYSAGNGIKSSGVFSETAPLQRSSTPSIERPYVQ